MAYTLIDSYADGRSVYNSSVGDTRPSSASITNLKDDSVLYEGANEYRYRKITDSWVQIRGDSGAAHVTDPLYTLVKYSGGGYTYLCEAAMGTARSTLAWRVLRITDATGDIVYAGVAGTTVGTFAFAATDLATVAALTYTLGA